jgi:hypothetical protein
MKRKTKWSKIEERFRPLADGNELREALSVGDDNLLLRALVHVLHRKALELSEQAGMPALPTDQAKGLAMSAGAVEDAADELLQMVDEARKAMRGVKTEK